MQTCTDTIFHPGCGPPDTGFGEDTRPAATDAAADAEVGLDALLDGDSAVDADSD